MLLVIQKLARFDVCNAIIATALVFINLDISKSKMLMPCRNWYFKYLVVLN